MKIVYASGTPLAGVSELMTRMVNQYLSPEHEARCLSRGTGLHSGWYRRPGVNVPFGSIRDKKQVNRALEWADVVHCMANVSANTMSRPDLIKKKIWVFNWHGAQIWPFKRVWNPQDYRHVRWIHIGQGWTRQEFFKQFRYTIIPNLISIEDEIHTPIPWKERKRKVAFAPSNMSKGAVNAKGPEVVKKACKEADARLDLIHGLSFETCMRKKGTAVLGIDEVVSPLYHRSGLEFLSQGVPCICSFDKFTIECLYQAIGTKSMPFINASKRNLPDIIKGLIAGKELEDRGSVARFWMEKNYHPEKLLRRYLEVYENGN